MIKLTIHTAHRPGFVCPASQATVYHSPAAALAALRPYVKGRYHFLSADWADFRAGLEFEVTPDTAADDWADIVTSYGLPADMWALLRS